MSKFDEAYLQSLLKTLFPSLLSKQQNLEFAKQMRNGDSALVERVTSSDLPSQHSASTVDDLNSSDMGSRKGLLGLFEGNSWSARTLQNSPRTNQAAFSLTYDSGILAGGQNSTSIIAESERYSDFFNVWVNATSLSINKSNLVGTTLTSDLGMTVGGYNGTGYVNTSERFSASGNSWTARGTFLVARENSGSICLTNDIFVIAGGSNASFLSDCDKYTNSTNIWISTGAYPTPLKYGCGLSITGEGGLVCGGENSNWNLMNTANKYSAASSLWTAKTNLLNVRTTFMNNGITLSSEMGLISGGRLHSYSWYLFNESSEIFIDSMNVWNVTIAATSSRSFSSSMSFSFNSGLMVGGITRPSPFTFQPPERYRNGMYLLNYISNGMYAETTFMSQNSSCPLPCGKDYFIYSNRLSNQKEPIDKLFVSALYYKHPNSNPITFDFSLDDGWTYKEDLPLDVYYDSQGIKPLDDNYKLKLRFELNRSSNINTWTTLVNTPQYRSWPTNVTLTNDIGLLVGGYDGVSPTGGTTGSNYKYSKSTNSYSSRAIHIGGYTHYNAQGLTLSSDQALVCGGDTRPITLANTQKYFDSQNIWVAKLNIIARSGSASLSLAPQVGILACGYYSGSYSGNTISYISSTDTWSTLVVNLNGRKDCGANSYNSNSGVVFGGAITGDAAIPNNDKLSVSENIWTSKTTMIFAKQDFGSCSLTSTFGMQAGGNNGILTYDTSKYFDLQNIWISRTSIPLARSGVSGWSFDVTNATIVGGGNPTSKETLRYNDGETVLYGFSVIGPISKITPMIRNNDDIYITTDRPYTSDPGPDPRIPLKAINPTPIDGAINVSDYVIAPVAGTWTLTPSSMNYLVDGLGGCGVATNSLAFGGCNTSNVVGTAEKWDNSTWQIASPMIIPKRFMGSCGTVTDALCFGGQTNYSGSYISVTEKWDGAAWHTVSSLNHTKHRVGGCGTTSAALAIGGWNGSYYSEVERWDGSGGSWSILGSGLSVQKEDVIVSGTTTSALAFGGNNSVPSSYLATTEKWDGSSWTVVGNLNQARRELAGCGNTTSALAFGGRNVTETDPTLATTEIWADSIWVITTNMNKQRARLGGCGTTTTALAFSGSTNFEKFERSSEKWNSGGGGPVSGIMLWNNGGNASTYDVYFASHSPLIPSDKKTTDQITTSYNPVTLSLNTTYYWRVDSRNSYGLATGDVWHFTTNTSPTGNIGLIAGGHNGSGSVSSIQWIRINNLSNTQSWGNLTTRVHLLGAGGNTVYGIFAGGDSSNTWQGDTPIHNIYYTNYATINTMNNWGNLTTDTSEHTAFSNVTRMIVAGGSNSSREPNEGIQYFDLASTGNASDFGVLTDRKDCPCSCVSQTRGVIAGGHEGSPGIFNEIDYVTIATKADAADFGHLQKKRVDATGFSSNTRGIIAGGDNGSATGGGPYLDLIEYVTISVSGGIAGSFGNLSFPHSQSASVSDKIYGIICGGYNGSRIQSMQYVTIASTGASQSFGNLTTALRSPTGTSNSHGGL